MNMDKVLDMNHEVVSEENKVILFRKWKDDNDIKARDQLVMCHLRFIKSIALKYRKSTEVEIIDDLIQEGLISFMKSLDSYDPSKSAFTTYANRPIHNAMQEFLRKDNTVTVPNEGERLNRKLSKAKYELLANNALTGSLLSDREHAIKGDIPTDRKLADITGINITEVVNGLEKRVSVNSMDKSLDSEDEGSGLHEILHDGTCLYDGIEADNLELKALEMLECLPRDQRIMLTKYFGLASDEPMSLKDLGVGSKQNAEKRVKVALKRLRKLGIQNEIW